MVRAVYKIWIHHTNIKIDNIREKMVELDARREEIQNKLWQLRTQEDIRQSITFAENRGGWLFYIGSFFLILCFMLPVRYFRIYFLISMIIMLVGFYYQKVKPVDLARELEERQIIEGKKIVLDTQYYQEEKNLATVAAELEDYQKKLDVIEDEFPPHITRTKRLKSQLSLDSVRRGTILPNQVRVVPPSKAKIRDSSARLTDFNIDQDSRCSICYQIIDSIFLSYSCCPVMIHPYHDYYKKKCPYCKKVSDPAMSMQIVEQSS